MSDLTLHHLDAELVYEDLKRDLTPLIEALNNLVETWLQTVIAPAAKYFLALLRKALDDLGIPRGGKPLRRRKKNLSRTKRAMRKEALILRSRGV